MLRRAAYLLAGRSPHHGTAIHDPRAQLSSAERTAVLPYYRYAGQDRKDKPRVQFQPSSLASLIEARNRRMLTLDLRTAQIQGFSISRSTTCSALRDDRLFQTARHANLTGVSPDAGGVERAAPSPNA
jgi:ribose-phosphate pyrophosphokinase